MANNDPAIYTLRYNEASQAIEAAIGLDWYPVALTNLDGITQLVGQVTAGPGSGVQSAFISNNVITDAMINSAAAISLSKLAALTANRVLISDSSGVISASGVTALTLTYLDATSSIQTQLNSKQSTLTIGNLTDVGTDGIAITGGTGAVIGSGTTIAQQAATASLNGYLTSANFTTFNNKQPAGSYITALTGDVSATGPNSATATLATVNSNIGTFASVTVNGKGLVTAAGNLTGDVTTSSAVSTLATVNTNVGSFTNASITVNGKGLITAASSGAAASGTVNSGTATHLAYYATSTNAVSDANGASVSGAYTFSGASTFAVDQQFTSGFKIINIGGGSNTATIRGANFASSDTILIPDPGTSPANFVLSEGAATINGNKTLSGTTNLSGLTASTALALDSSKNIVSVTNTGTGNNVLATSPTLVTPTLGAATATSLTFSPTTGGIVGTTTNDNTTAGDVGEYIASTSAQINFPGASGAWGDITSISLTAGDWDVVMQGFTNANGALGLGAEADFGIGQVAGNTSPTTLTLDWNAGLPPSSSDTAYFIMKRLSIASTTIVYAKIRGTYSSGNPVTQATIFARRVR